jgi:hypothetical protein
LDHLDHRAGELVAAFGSVLRRREDRDTGQQVAQILGRDVAARRHAARTPPLLPGLVEPANLRPRRLDPSAQADDLVGHGVAF